MCLLNIVAEALNWRTILSVRPNERTSAGRRRASRALRASSEVVERHIVFAQTKSGRSVHRSRQGEPGRRRQGKTKRTTDGFPEAGTRNLPSFGRVHRFSA